MEQSDGPLRGIAQGWSGDLRGAAIFGLGFLEKLALFPGDVGLDDLVPLREAGVSEQGTEEAISICSLFNIVDGIADALGFEVPSAESLAKGAGHVLKRGYL